MKTYRIISTPTYCGGDLLGVDGYEVGALVHVDNFSPDGDGDVCAYLIGTPAHKWHFVAAKHLRDVDEAPTGNPRAALIREARELLGPDANASEILAVAEFLAGGAA